LNQMQELAGNGKITARQEKAIIELLNPTNKSILGIAYKLNIGERTLHAWLKQPKFKEALFNARKELTKDSLNKLKESLGEAVNVINGLMGSDKEMISLKASQLVIDYNLKLREDEEFEERLSRLEEVAKNEKKRF